MAPEARPWQGTPGEDPDHRQGTELREVVETTDHAQVVLQCVDDRKAGDRDQQRGDDGKHPRRSAWLERHGQQTDRDRRGERTEVLSSMHRRHRSRETTDHRKCQFHCGKNGDAEAQQSSGLGSTHVRCTEENCRGEVRWSLGLTDTQPAVHRADRRPPLSTVPTATEMRVRLSDLVRGGLTIQVGGQDLLHRCTLHTQTDDSRPGQSSIRSRSGQMDLAMAAAGTLQP